MEDQPNSGPSLTPDTEAQNPTPPHPDDPQRTGGGDAQAPGGQDAPDRNAAEMTHGQDSYPGPRTDSETAKTTGTPQTDGTSENASSS